MALILPFRGIHYDAHKVGDFGDVVAPPYDVISPEAQEGFYRRHPHNIIRLILNRETPEDSPQNNRYTRAAASYRGWLQQGILIRSSRPCFYFLREEFDAPGGRGGASRRLRQGFIGLIQLQPFTAGVVLPHEKTQTEPKADRLALMEACRANFSQIFSLYQDEEGVMADLYGRVFSSSAGPAFDVTDEEGVRHTLWSVSDPTILRRVGEIMQPKKIFIADGHHRYETALAYREKERARNAADTGRETYHFTMMYFAALEDPGIVILPTHRAVVPIPGFQSSSFLEKLGRDFSIETFAFQGENERTVRERFLRELASRPGQARSLGMLPSSVPQYFLLTLKEGRILEEAAPALGPALKSLDVNLLHILIFQKILGIGPAELAAGQHVLYFKEPEAAVQAVQSGRGQMAFFLNPTRVHQVRDVSLAGDTMPPKSTFFYPKLLSGLVINPLEPDERIVLE